MFLFIRVAFFVRERGVFEHPTPLRPVKTLVANDPEIYIQQEDRLAVVPLYPFFYVQDSFYTLLHKTSTFSS